ncbi:hypothetical protein [Amycolatopsis australiensis]|uniref:Uncharacterized protein n=1 Tax=Amycolatopsis australiensis TaxID=546364 RepID=A0A1K1QCN8_9PSEU|nr:hypothetical protein [Amycolatopsis australiensis]SFW57687.1 hypothetical protein SAMN04489730_1638 [Amycolatopsis australiensis]
MSDSVAPWLVLVVFLAGGSAFAFVISLVLIRLKRHGEPREMQLRRLAARLDGRPRVTIRTVEFSVAQADLFRVAQSRGYSMTENRFGRYYTFFRTPHQPWTSV